MAAPVTLPRRALRGRPQKRRKRFPLSAIRGLIREELRNLDLTTEKSQQAQAGDMDENVLGFLLALQQEGDEIT